MELDRGQLRSGETLAGRIGGAPAATSVKLVRVERAPHVERSFVDAETQVSRPEGVFALATPGTLLPTARGGRCSLSYLVCAEVPGGLAYANVTVAASARPHLEVGSAHADRLLLSWDARHFHIEIAEADLYGGGKVEGRVHRDRPWRTDAVVVCARCEECWQPSALAVRGFPYWEWSPLWGTARSLWLDPDASWAPFCFELPPELPPAVEGRTIAWRYELVARRRRRYWFDETAALTPLLHEEPMPSAISGPDPVN